MRYWSTVVVLIVSSIDLIISEVTMTEFQISHYEKCLQIISNFEKLILFLSLREDELRCIMDEYKEF